MKRKLVPLIIFALLIALTPALSLLSGQAAALRNGTSAVDPPASAVSASDGAASEPVYEGGSITVLDEATGSTLTLTEREYVLGALMSEMPALFEMEALKAQAVACHTYALNVQSARLANPDPELKGAAFRVDTSRRNGYITREQAQAIYGSYFEEYYSKMQQAVDETLRYVLTYENEPIAACYHAISPGRTENSENVFVTALPYLVSVDSTQDLLAPEFETEVRLTSAEFEDYMRYGDNTFTVIGEPSQWLGDTVTTETGTVLKQTICGKDYAGTAVRTFMSLRSAAFTVRYEDGFFIFRVRGHGHGVGLSQYGANGMAQEGKTFEEILSHYYPGTALSKVD